MEAYETELWKSPKRAEDIVNVGRSGPCWRGGRGKKRFPEKREDVLNFYSSGAGLEGQGNGIDGGNPLAGLSLGGPRGVLLQQHHAPHRATAGRQGGRRQRVGARWVLVDRIQ